MIGAAIGSDLYKIKIFLGTSNCHPFVPILITE